MAKVAAFFVAFATLAMLAQAFRHSALPQVPAMFVFGDSLVDSGTNNFLPNSTIVANMRPYGQSYFDWATGRFTDGRTTVDLLAQALGLPLPSPFLNPAGLLKLHGANFASAGSGFLDATDESDGVVPLTKQLEQFMNWTDHLRTRLSDAVLEDYLQRSVAVISTGSNDISNNYLSNITLMFHEKAPEFIESLLQDQVAAIKALHKSGLRKILVLGLAPIGCAPKARFLASRLHLASSLTGCFEGANIMAQAFNNGLKAAMAILRVELQDPDLILMKPYDLLLEVIHKPEHYGFVNVTDACCGAGPFNSALRCGLFYGQNDLKPYLCKDPSKYLFWDYGHPTEAAYKLLLSKVWYGGADVVEPINLSQLFSGTYVAVPKKV